jgi:hypothetical protein
VCATSSIATIGSTQGCEFITHEVLIASTTVSAATKDSNLVNKVAFFQVGDL